MFKLLIFGFIYFLTLFPAYSQTIHPRGITLDGTIGNRGKQDLQGPNYDIKAEYGKQAGSNLFHSFQKFNIHSDESATFSGPSSVQNIINRVTGGDISWIDGRLNSTIPNADVYLINPAGVKFGENASLNIGGSFHVSTADYLRMGENEYFYSTPHQNELLSTSPPTAFGFLNPDAGSISFEGKGELTPQVVWGENDHSWNDWFIRNNLDPKDSNSWFYNRLTVSKGKTISLIGGNIDIKGVYAPYGMYRALESTLYAPEGRLNLASVKSSGEVIPEESDLRVTSSRLGNITMSDGAGIDSGSSSKAGAIFIRAGEFVMDKSEILSRPYAAGGGKIDIQAEKILIQNQSDINTSSWGAGKGTDLSITASTECHLSQSDIRNIAYPEASGHAGAIVINSAKLFMDGGRIFGQTFGAAHCGDITIKSSVNAIFTNESWLSATALDGSSGQSGNIIIHSPEIRIQGKSIIESKTIGAGKNGSISIHTQNMNMTSGGILSVKTEQSADGGSIFISGLDPDNYTDAANSVMLIDPGTEIQAVSSGSGNAGSVSIFANQISISDRASITTLTSHSGNAGNVTLNCGKIDLTGGGFISSLSRYPSSNVFTSADVSGLEQLRVSTEEGDVAIVWDSGNGNPTAYVRYRDVTDMEGNSLSWIPMSKEIITASNLTERNLLIDFNTPGIGKGNTVIVKDAGDGKPAAFVYTGLMWWVKLNNFYQAESLEYRDKFIKFPGDVVQIKTGNRIDQLTYTGSEWIAYQNLFYADSLRDRELLFPQKGDVAKVLNAGDGVSRACIYDGQKWTDSYITGNAGTITINATNNVTLSEASGILASTAGGIRAGVITLKTQDLNISNTAHIQSTASSVGDAGTINIYANNSVKLKDDAYLSTATSGHGRAGDIVLTAGTLELKDSAYISSSTDFQEKGGAAGTISLDVKNSIFMTDKTTVKTSSNGQGNAGNVSIKTGTMRLCNDAFVSSKSNSPQNGGAAGMITVDSNDSLVLNDSSSLTTESVSSGGGKIFVNARNFVYLLNGRITSSVKQGEGKAGDITIGSPDSAGDGPEVVILNHSSITANAEEGDGGAIFINTKNFIKSTDSKVTAGSKRGNNGTVKIQAPDLDLSADLTVLPGNYLDAAQWLKLPCAARSSDAENRFAVKGRDAARTSYDDWLASPPIFLNIPCLSNPLTEIKSNVSLDGVSKSDYDFPCSDE